MLTEHLRKVIDQLASLPAEEQESYAAQLEADLRERIAAQLADPLETDSDALLDEARREVDAGEVSDLDEILAGLG